MKKRILLFTLTSFLGYFLLTSYKFGPAANYTNTTGAHGSVTSCASTGGCHGSGAGPSVTITVDSGTTAVTSYKAGKNYKIHIHGTGTSMIWWGFEFACVSGTGTSQVTAGTWGAAPGGLQTSLFTGINFMEHSTPLKTSAAGSFDTSFTWNAPATTGTGTISMYCSINAVNGNGLADAGDVSGNRSMQLTEQTNVGVNTVLNNLGIQTYPNPFSNNFHVQMSNADAGTYSFNIFDITGRAISSQNVAITSGNYETNINTANWPKGNYFLQIVNNGAQRAIQLVKE